MLICRALVEGGGRVVEMPTSSPPRRMAWNVGGRGGASIGQAEHYAAKLLRPGFRRIDDAAWTGGRPRNIVVEATHS